MKILESALLLVVGTSLLTFVAISFALFPRPFTATNPTLLVEAMGVAGALLIWLGSRGLHRVHRALRGDNEPSSMQPAA